MKKVITLMILSLLIPTTVLKAEIYLMNPFQESLTKNIIVEPNITSEVEEEIDILECILPDILNESGDGCINNVEAVGWIDISDTCGGMRSTNFDENIVYARSKSSFINRNLEIPQGYRWLSVTEFFNLYNASTYPNKLTDGDNNYAYYGQCGNTAYPKSQIENIDQNHIQFNQQGYGIHTGHMPLHHLSSSYHTYEATTKFLGYVLYKEY